MGKDALVMLCFAQTYREVDKRFEAAVQGLLDYHVQIYRVIDDAQGKVFEIVGAVLILSVLDENARLYYI